MNHINRRILTATLLAIYCFCSTTLLGSLDNIWYTYDIFLTKKLAMQATTTETAETKEANQPKPQLLIEAPYGQLATIHGLAAIWKGVIRHIYDNAPMFNMEEAAKVARAKAEEEVAKLAKAHAEQQAAVEAKEAKGAAPAIEQKPAAVTVQRLTNTILHKLIDKHIGLPPAKGDVPASEDKEAKQPAKQPDGMAIIRLVHTIFHRQDPTQLTQGDFVITDQLKNCTKDTIAEFVGLLLATIEHGREHRNQFALTSTNKWVRELDETNLKDESKEKICKGLVTQKDKDAAIKNAVNYSRLTLQNTVNFAIEACKPEYLEKSPFPPETVYLVLLGLLYQHTGLDHPSLKTYYTALANRYSKLDGIIKSFRDNVLTIKEPRLPKTATDVKKLNNNLTSAAQQYTTVTDGAIAFIHKNYEEFVFMSLLPGLLPPGFNYADSTMSVFDVKTNTFMRTGPVITDCMDSVMRKICNVLALNTKTRIFSVPMLTSRQRDIEDETTEDQEKKQTEASTIHPAIKAFYTKHRLPNNVGDSDQHSDWLAVISNIPYVAYANKGGSNVYQNWPGYINIPATDLKTNEALTKFLADTHSTHLDPITNTEVADHYVVVQDKDAVLYEIQPSIRNIIIALDYLLNLNLFGGKLATAFTDPAFIKTYLPKLSQALNLELDLKQSGNLETIDDQDLKGSEHSIVMGLPNKPAQFRITITSGHGAFKSLGAQSRFDLPIFQEALAKHNLLPSSALFFHDSKTPSICSLKDPKSIYLSLFAIELDNPDAISNISESTCLLVSKDIVNLLFYCIGRHPDVTQRVKSQFNLYHNFCQRGDIDTILTKEMYKQILSLIVNSYDCLPGDAYQDLFKKLCGSKTYNEVLVTFFNKLFSPKELPETNNISTRFVLDLFKWNMSLDNEKTAKAEIAKLIHYHVINTVTRALISKEESNIQKALILLNSLVEHPEYEMVCRKAITSIALGLDDRSIPIILQYPNLLSFFIKNHTEFHEEFQQLILTLIETYDGSYNPILFDQPKLLDATATVIATFKPANAKIVVTKALSHAKSILGHYTYWDKIPDSYLNAIEFLQKLVEHGYQESYSAAMDFGLHLDNIFISKASLDILIALATQKYGSQEEYEQIIKNLTHFYTNDTELADKVVKLRAVLAERGCGTKQAIEAAIKTLNDEFPEDTVMTDPETQRAVIAKRLTLFESLLKNKLGYADAIKTANELWLKKAPTQYQLKLMFKREALALLQRLFTYGYGMEEAQKLAFNAIAKADQEIKYGTSYDRGYSQRLGESDLDERRTVKNMAITLLTTLVKRQYGQSEDYKQILAILPALLEHELSKACINLCAELFRQEVGIDVVLKVAIDRLNNVNQDGRNESFEAMEVTTEALLKLSQSQSNSIATNNAEFKKLMAQYLDLFNLLLQNKKGSAAITEFATALWQKPPTQPRYSSDPRSAFLFSCKREAVELFELLLNHGYGIKEASHIAEDTLKQLKNLDELVEKKKSEITNNWQKDSAWEDKEVSELLQNLSITYRWNIQETIQQLDLLEMLANYLLKAAQKAQAVQEEVATKARAAQEEAVKAQTAQAQATHVAEAQKESPKHDERKDEEKPARAQTPDESWVCPICETENKPPLPGQRAVCAECQTPKA